MGYQVQKKKEKLKKKEKKIIKFASEDVQDSDSDISSPLCGGGTTTIPKQRKRGRPRKDVVNSSATGTGTVVAKVAKPATNLNRYS